MDQMQIQEIYFKIMDYYNIMKNIILSFCLPFILLIGCKPKPNLNILVSASFKVKPNIEKIKLGDTLCLSLNANANFPMEGGGTYLFENGKLSPPLYISEIDSNSSYGYNTSQRNSFKVITNRGEFLFRSSYSMFAEINTTYINNEYVADICLIPQKKGTFFIWVLRTNLSNNKQSVPAQINFLSNNQHLHLVPPSFTANQRSEMYAFIVE